MQQAIRMRIEADKAALDAGFTTNNFVGELGEKLAHAVYGGHILPNSAKSADIQTDDGTLLQVKTRKPNKGKQFGSIRSWDFDYLGNDSNLLVVFYVQIMPDDFVMQLHRF